MSTVHESVRWDCKWGVQKWDEEAVAWLTEKLGRTPQAADFEAAHIDPYEESKVDGNLLLTAGLDRLTNLFIGGGAQALNNTHCRIGVGDSTTAEAVGQTDLQAVAGSTHRWFQMADATYPQQANGVITVKATFATGDGNFAWNEFGIDAGTASANTVTAPLVNRKASIAQGTKVSGQSWTPTATITLS